MDWMTLLETAGPLAVGAAAVGTAAWRMLLTKDKIIADKDKEIKRVNEARISEKQSSMNTLLGIVTEFHENTIEQTKTMKTLAEKK